MNLTVAIESAELQFKQILEEFFISVYDEKSLPSHGINHHRRVWNYARELISVIENGASTFDPALPSKLIIACYLHDAGMSIETGIRHGKHSKDLCIRFLKFNQFHLNDYQDVLDAIEFHDRKDYSENNSANEILKILSVSDDLDAFGFIGIFRYTEIYLTRRIIPENMGHLIKENAGKRLDNFENTFWFAEDLVKKHKKRYNILDNFFNEYNEQVKSYKFGGQHPSGYCGVVEVLLEMQNNNKDFKDIYKVPEKCSSDPVICWFFDELSFESITYV